MTSTGLPTPRLAERRSAHASGSNTSSVTSTSHASDSMPSWYRESETARFHATTASTVAERQRIPVGGSNARTSCPTRVPLRSSRRYRSPVACTVSASPGAEGGDGEMHRVTGWPACGEAEVYIAQAEAPIAAFEWGRPQRRTERRPAQDGWPGRQPVAPAACFLEAGERQRAAGARHGHVAPRPGRIRVFSSARTVPHPPSRATT